jgi:hypothetical protein
MRSWRGSTSGRNLLITTFLPVCYMVECFGHKADCRAPCEVAARCIEESGRIFAARSAPHAPMGELRGVTAIS